MLHLRLNVCPGRCFSGEHSDSAHGLRHARVSDLSTKSLWGSESTEALSPVCLVRLGSGQLTPLVHSLSHFSQKWSCSSHLEMPLASPQIEFFPSHQVDLYPQI